MTSTPARPPAETTEQANSFPMPKAVNALLVIFYVLMWLNLVYSTYEAVQDVEEEGGDYGFLIPVALYVLVFIVQFIISRREYKKVGGSLSDQLWGCDEPAWRQFAFIMTCTVLVFWMNFESLRFLFIYLPLIGFTVGSFWGRNGVLLGLLQTLCFAYFLGFFGNYTPVQFSSEAVLGISISFLAFLSTLVMIIVLMRSRIESEILVRELQATKKQLEEALVTEKEVAVLRERNRMAREMHDVLGHALVLVAVKIEASQRLQAIDPERAVAELEATKELVRQSMADLRVSLADLRSPTFEAGKAQLGDSLREWAARTATEVGLSVKFESEPEVETLPAPVQDALWRVGREAVLNIVKHARAKHAELHLFVKDGKAYLSVMDDGVGIPHLAEGDARLEVAGHYGIRGMRERLESLGGELTLKPGREVHGTMVLASVPLPVDPIELNRIENSKQKAEGRRQKAAT